MASSGEPSQGVLADDGVDLDAGCVRPYVPERFTVDRLGVRCEHGADVDKRACGRRPIMVITGTYQAVTTRMCSRSSPSFAWQSA